MKRIVCYGDSNTHGYCPENGFRYDESIRWTWLLKKALGEEFDLIEEGYNGRTVNLDDSEGVLKNGKTYLYPCIRTHSPIDMVVLMLGSNDLKLRFHRNATDIGKGIEELISIIREASREKHPEGREAEILLISPPYIGENMETSVFAESFGGRRAVEISRELPSVYKKIADEYGVYYLDASKIAQVSFIDSLHFDAAGHGKMAKAVYRKICQIYANSCI